MPIIYVLHLFLRPLQSNFDERKHVYFPTRGTPLNTEPCFNYVAQTQDGVIADREIEFELSDYLAANVTRYAWSFPGLRVLKTPPRWVNSCILVSPLSRPYAGHPLRHFCHWVALK